MTNPYAGFGGIVYGNQFVGRDELIQSIHERVFTADPGCLSLVGLPRIGKSSLAYQALICERDRAYQYHILPIWIGMGSFTASQDFFAELVMAARDELMAVGVYNDAMKRYADMALQPACPWLEFKHCMQRFFSRARASGWRLVFVIDEFDAAKTVFGNNAAAFQAMRELYNSPEWRVAFVTTSRRRIEELEAFASISNLHGIFTSVGVGLFSQQEVQMFLQGLEATNMPLEPDDVRYIQRSVGAHPYLLSHFAFHLSAIWNVQREVDIDKAVVLSHTTFVNYFNDLVDLFRDEGVLPALLATASGRQPYNPTGDTDKLRSYGVIQVGAGYRHEVFSTLFQGYLVELQNAARFNKLLGKGELVGNKYRILTNPRTTAHSQLVKAWDENLERPVAIKCVYASEDDKKAIEDLRSLLIREGQILANLSHPNIGMIYEILQDPLAIVVEWVEGESLEEILNMNRKLPIAEIARMGIQVADALNYIHEHTQNIVHRDIKPSNIIRNTSGIPKLVDFDIAHARSQHTLIGDNGPSITRIGTGDFSSPEQYRNASIGPAADVFSLGVVLYELCTHVLPFRYHTDWDCEHLELPVPAQLTIPDPLYQILCGCLQARPEQRPTAAQLRQQLEHYVSIP